MGRSPWSDRKTVEECTSISISDLLNRGIFEKKRGYLVPWSPYALGREVSSIAYWVKTGPEGNIFLQVSYKMPSWFYDIKVPLDYVIELTTTTCNFGGKRHWFICPLRINGLPCRRRVGKLYLPPGEKYFGCRSCYNLTYQSCKEHQSYKGHDKRVDALMENPDLLSDYIESHDPKHLKLAVKACGNLLDRTLRSRKKRNRK